MLGVVDGGGLFGYLDCAWYVCFVLNREVVLTVDREDVFWL